MEDFESTPEFQALVVSATGKPERSMGDSVIPAEPPQWSEVRRLASDLLATAGQQLPVHIYLIQAETNIKGFGGFQTTLQSMMQLFQDQWDEVYPEPDLDDPDDMYYARVNLVNELSEQPAFLDTIYRLPLVKVRGLGEFSTRDIDISVGLITGTDEEQARCQEGLIRGAFAESDAEQLQSMAGALNVLPELCTTIERVFAEKTGQQNVLSLGRLKERLANCKTRFHEYADDNLASPAADEPSHEESGMVSEAARRESVEAQVQTGSITDRALVKAAFDAVALYYQQYEPSSPVRVLVYRASTFVDISFFEVLQALAPDQHDNFPALLLQLQKQPLAALLNDCYARHCSGESLPVLNPPSQTSDTATAAPEIPAMDTTAIEPGNGVIEEHGSESTAMSDSAGNNHSASEIYSRQQVLDVLQDIESYFRTSEPASPVPLIVADIRKLVHKRFEELVAEFSRLLPVELVSE